MSLHMSIDECDVTSVPYGKLGSKKGIAYNMDTHETAGGATCPRLNFGIEIRK